MTHKCLNPLIVYQCGTHINAKGKVVKTILFDATSARLNFATEEEFNNAKLELPCGKCEVCKKNKRKEMTVRLTNEIESHEDSCFITLTYKPEKLPYVNVKTGEVRRYEDIFDVQDDILFHDEYLKDWTPTLVKTDLQNYIKRQRKYLYSPLKKKKDGRDYVDAGKLRYFAVGEYGTKKSRPHWHIIIFGWNPSDKEVFCNRGQYNLYRSKQIEANWDLGISTVGDCNNAVAKYCAQYVTKKEDRNLKYKSEFVQKECVLCSKMNGALGATYCDKYWKQILEQKGVVLLNRKTGQAYKYKIPAYYKNRIARLHPDAYQAFLDAQEKYIVQLINEEAEMTPELTREQMERQIREMAYWRELESRKEKSRGYESEDQMFDQYALLIKYLNSC